MVQGLERKGIVMEQEDVTPQNLVNHLRSIIDKLEQQMAAMVGMNLYKQQDGFTQEQLYLYGGREDSVFTLILREESESFKKYGEEITVCFVYPREERKDLEKDSTALNNIPYVKAKLLVPYGDEYEEIAKELLNVGVNTEDIIQVLVLPPFDKNNTFPSKEKRTPKVLEIPFHAQGKGSDIGWMYSFLKRLKEDNVGLMPEDEAAYMAFKCILEPELLTEEESHAVYDSKGKMNDDVLRHYLLWKQDAEVITEEENEELKRLKKKRLDVRMSLLEKALRDQGLSLSKLRKDYPEQAALILSKVITFNDRTFNSSGRFPLYMNFETLLHIYLRHTEEMNVGGQFVDRDKFQLEEKDILTVMNIVMRDLNDEYQAFKEKNPEGRFFRSGRMAYYYNGDYYHVNVNADGSISTFYKGSGDKK